MHRVLSHSLHFNDSYRSIESMTRIINATPQSSIQLPRTKYKIKNFFQPAFKSIIFVKCSTCANFSPNNSECTICSTIVRSSNSQYFVYIPIEQQLKQTIEMHLNEIISYYSKVKNEPNGISDLHNTENFKRIQKKYGDLIVLPLIVNTDGVQVFKSTTKSLWLIQIGQGFLPPKMRYMPENILLAAAHFDYKKPDMKSFFYPFLKELRNINNNGGIAIKKNNFEYRFMPLIMNACCDLPAKADLQCFAGHSGHFACGYCLHPGISVKPDAKGKAVIRYINKAKNYQIRSHGEVLEAYEKKVMPINGIKSMSCMIAAKEFNLIHSFSIDYMHCVLLGVIKKTLSLWLDSKIHTQAYVTLYNKFKL